MGKDWGEVGGRGQNPRNQQGDMVSGWSTGDHRASGQLEGPFPEGIMMRKWVMWSICKWPCLCRLMESLVHSESGNLVCFISVPTAHSAMPCTREHSAGVYRMLGNAKTLTDKDSGPPGLLLICSGTLARLCHQCPASTGPAEEKRHCRHQILS